MHLIAYLTLTRSPRHIFIPPACRNRQTHNTGNLRSSGEVCSIHPCSRSFQDYFCIEKPPSFSYTNDRRFRYVGLSFLQQNAFGKNPFKKICIRISKIDLISGITDKLCQKYTSNPAIAILERMRGVGDATESSNLLREFIMGQTFEIAAGPKPFKNQPGLTFTV